MNVSEILASQLDDQIKGIPGGVTIRLEEIGAAGWNVLREDVPLPAAVIKSSALNHNRSWMTGFVEETGVLLCPHGKTTMCPQLFQLQLDGGAWGITAATVSQLQVYRRYGVSRVFFANQLVGKQNIRYVLDELERDPDFDFYCLVDSVRGVEALTNAARGRPLSRPVQVLVEGGYPNGRTGVRGMAEALDVARAVRNAGSALALRGVEGFEGILMVTASAESHVQLVTEFLEFLVDIARAFEQESLFADGPVVMSAGGSAFFDLVTSCFSKEILGRETQVVLRSGCYLTHDSSLYTDLFTALSERSTTARNLGSGLQPAIEVWAYVQSRPETGLVILTMGKRDCSYDIQLPTPRAWFRPGSGVRPQALGAQYTITGVTDQHAHLVVPEESPLLVGDLVGCGISHPCTTFDRWQLLFIVNDDYDITSAVRTFF